MMNKPFSRQRYALFSLVFLLIIQLFGCKTVKHSFYETALNYEHWKASLDEKTLDWDGKPIAYLENPDDGTKQSIVLIHGYSANKENWVRFAAYLTPAYHVVAIDLPGHGESVKDLQMSYKWEDQVQHLYDILAKLGLNEFHLAGNSMGGGIAALYAVKYPKQVKSLLLIDPAGIEWYKSPLIEKFKKGENPFIIRSQEDYEKLMHFAMVKVPFIPWPIIDVMAEKAIENQQINGKILADIMADKHAFVNQFKKISEPSLIMWGAQDRLLNVTNAYVLKKRIPNSRLIVFEGVGHVPMIEVPEKAAEGYIKFLNNLGVQAPG